MKKLKIVFAVLCMFCLTGCGEKEILGGMQTYENITYQETNKETIDITFANKDLSIPPTIQIKERPIRVA